MTTSQMPCTPALRAFLADEAVQPLGFRRDGRPIFPIAGGAPDGGDGTGGDGGQGAGQNGGQQGGGSGQGGDQGTGGTGGQQTGQQTGQQAADGQQGQQVEWDGKVESLPDGVQKIIRELRQEAGDERVATKTLAAIQKALNPDAGDDKPDPAKLAEQLNTERTEHTTLQSTHADLQREHQVLLAALDAGADHKALLDSRSFLTKVADLDPAASDFAAKVKSAVDTAVTENPKLKTGRAPGASSVDHAGGSGEQRRTSNGPVSLDSAVSAHYGTS